MKSTKEKRIEYQKRVRNRVLLWLGAVMSITGVVCNIVSVKVIPLFDTQYTLSMSAIFFVIMFFISNFVNEFWNKEQAIYLTFVSFACQLIAAGLLGITVLMPSTDGNIGTAFNTVIKSNVIFLVSGIIAYLVSAGANIIAYSGIRVSGLSIGMSSALALVISQAVDTFIFSTLGYGAAFNWIFDGGDFWGRIWPIFLGQFIIKLIFIAVLSPVFIGVCGMYKKYINN